MAVATVDLTQQRLQITPLPGTLPVGPFVSPWPSPNVNGLLATPSAIEVWAQDVLVRVFALLGLYNVSFELNPPTNYRALWFSMNNPPTGAPGTLMIYDNVAQTWVPCTPSAFQAYLSIVGRPRVWYETDDLTQAIVADWLYDRTEDRLYFLVPLSPGETDWVDVTGAGIDPALIVAAIAASPATIISIVQTALNAGTLTLQVGPGLRDVAGVISESGPSGNSIDGGNA